MNFCIKGNSQSENEVGLRTELSFVEEFDHGLVHGGRPADPNLAQVVRRQFLLDELLEPRRSQSDAGFGEGVGGRGVAQLQNDFEAEFGVAEFGELREGYRMNVLDVGGGEEEFKAEIGEGAAGEDGVEHFGLGPDGGVEGCEFVLEEQVDEVAEGEQPRPARHDHHFAGGD